MSRRLLVVLEGRDMHVRGYGSRELCREVTGRVPMWSRSSRSWVLMSKRLADVIAAGERAGYAVQVIGESTPVAAPVVPVVEPAAGAARQDGEVPLW